MTPSQSFFGWGVACAAGWLASRTTLETALLSAAVACFLASLWTARRR